MLVYQPLSTCTFFCKKKVRFLNCSLNHIQPRNVSRYSPDQRPAMSIHRMKHLKKARIALGLLIIYLLYKTIRSFENTGNDKYYTEKDRDDLKKAILGDVPKNDMNLQKGDTIEHHSDKKILNEIPKLHNYEMYKESVKSCPNYALYSTKPHYLATDDLSDPDVLPYQRPPKKCRTFHSDSVEKVIAFMKENLQSPKLARLFENCFPNTLDTTILYHYNSLTHEKQVKRWAGSRQYRNEFSESFVITGDIHAEWLRDSAWQLSVYQPLVKYDLNLENLIKGAINTQAYLLMEHPYCNAFKAPSHMKIKNIEGQVDQVYPKTDWSKVFECKYEIDSLASFLTLSRQYYENSEKDISFINTDWMMALTQVLAVIRRESISTFSKHSHDVNPFLFRFQRNTNVGSETRPLAGTGNPVCYDSKLVKSAFRPSDDVTIFQFLVPGNAHLSVELTKMARILESHKFELEKVYAIAKKKYFNNSYNLLDIIEDLKSYGNNIKEGIYANAVFEDKRFDGDVLAYEVDGFGSRLMMDDANIPSLLSLPDLGFISKSDPLYLRSRKMILSPKGNPYAKPDNLYFPGIGSPHTGIHSVWPMSWTTAIRTSIDDKEIMTYLNLLVDNTDGLGLMHESINAYKPGGQEYTRPWFAWANSEFAKTVLYLADSKPHLIMKPGIKFNLKDILS